MESTYPTSAQDEYDEFSHSLFTPKAKRRDRKQYTLAFKTDIVRRVESGESVRLLQMVSNCVTRINQNPEMIRKVRTRKLNFKEKINFLNFLFNFIRRSRVVASFITMKRSTV